MKIIKNELIAHFDVDQTLVIHKKIDEHKSPLDLVVTDPHDGTIHRLTPHKAHIKLLKDFKSRGYHITVWSGGGWSWCETIVKALNLEDYVDVVMTKNIKFVDDLPANEVLGSRIYLDNK